ncbi:glycosyltransferase [Pseudomonas sp. OIL-1]|uniref:glycosyltransferase n=1 Tax=Pseudomonas sp. OIL-1 TaxID=2706126 RepID=UPI0013A73463|nr:glycosyltransferase [Pseudomonas sp. OIL-1]QIB52610.1 glycosyltransferase [Pseudomonas sp. OIL-1]
MQKKIFSYFALVDRARSPGVARKIDNTVLAAAHLGLVSKGNVFPTSRSGVIKFIVSLIKEDADIIMIRFSDLVFPVLFLVMVTHRVRGHVVIIDVPTPRIIGLKEIDATTKNKMKGLFRKIWSYCSGGWVLYPASLVIQYAAEGAWFSLGVSGKTLKIGNGIAIDDNIPLVKNVWPDDNLRLIGVAQLASWHGYDRLINALAVLKEKYGFDSVQLTLVGDGDELQKLKRLVENLGLRDQVSFTGMLRGDELDRAFCGAHIGISSLGLYRKGLNEASDLKTREYIARGLPVIGVGKDPDFEENSPFRFVVSNDDSVESLVELLYSLKGRELPCKESVRRFAEENLSLVGKLSMILGLR